MQDVAAQLDAFRHLQHLLDLLTTIEGVFRHAAQPGVLPVTGTAAHQVSPPLPAPRGS